MTRAISGDEARSGETRDSSVLVFPPFRLCPAEQRLWHQDRLIAVKPKTFDILQYFVERPGQLITREELRARFWSDVQVSEGVIKTHIREIRHALGDRARAARFIETANRRGYRFIARVEGHLRLPLVGGTAATEGRPAASPGDSDCFVGRDSEIDSLISRWRRACSGERQVVLVTGEAGVGKTALINRFRGQLRERDVLVSWGQCIDQYGAGEPYLPIIEALRRACTDSGNGRVAECVRRHAPAWLDVVPGAFTQTNRASGVTALAVQPERALRQLAETLEALAAQTTFVLLLEDLHWADPSSLDLLAYVAQRSDPARLLVVGTYRPVEAAASRLSDVVHTIKARNRCVELAVPQLSLSATRDYLLRRFATQRLSTGLAELLHARTEGHPLFMVGVVGSWLDRGLLRATEGGCDLAASLEELAGRVPDTLVRMIERELQRLTPLERAVLEAASVTGNEFSTAAVAAALSEDVVPIEEICMRWARRGQFIRSKGKAEWRDGTLSQRCEFNHILYQQITYDQIGTGRRAQWHLRVGERLEAGYADRAGSIGPELALHFERAGDYGRAVRYLRVSGEHALRHGAYREAIDHLMRALELIERLPQSEDKVGIELDLRMLLATPLRLTKGYAAPEVEQAYARAAQLCEARQATPQSILLLAGMGATYIIRGAGGVALELSQRLLRWAEHAGDRGAIVEASLLLGLSHHCIGHHRDARAHLAEAIAVPENLPAHTSVAGPHPDIASRCFWAMSSCMMGQLDQARQQMHNTLTRARRLDDPVALAFALNFSGHVEQLLCNFRATWQHANALAAHTAENGLGMFSAMAELQIGGAEIMGGDVASGLERLHRGRALLAATGTDVYKKYWIALIAEAYGKLGQPQRGLRFIADALPNECAGREQIWDAELLRVQGELLLACDHSAERPQPGQAPELSGRGPACLLQALEVARQQEAKLLELRAARSLAEHWQSQGDPARGRALLEDLYGSFSEGLDSPDLTGARLLLERLARIR